jgi:glycosyltransferase involved in cell wall biosynthesis
VNLTSSNLVGINPVVTVAMSVLNGGTQLQMAVRSIVEQTFEDWELLIIDDGSNDGAIEKLPFLNDLRVIVIRDGLNKGISARLNQAIDIARGQYFARMDHDDVCHPERFARQLDYLEAHLHVDLLATKCVTLNEKDKLVGALPFASNHEQICARPWLGFPMPHPSWMGRTAWFRRHYYQEPAPYCCEDNELLLRAYKSSVYHAIEQDLLAYRVRNHVPWSKMWKTRKAMGLVQINYFYGAKDWRSAILACTANFIRVARDAKSEISYRMGLTLIDMRLRDACADNEWLQWIEKLKR